MTVSRYDGVCCLLRGEGRIPSRRAGGTPATRFWGMWLWLGGERKVVDFGCELLARGYSHPQASLEAATLSE